MGRILIRLGFILKSHRGSHMKFVREVGIREIIIIPDHRVIKPGTLSAILKQLKLTPSDLRRLR